jgi:hypothetical protein
MLLSKGKIFSALAGLTMLALPVSAFAGHQHDNYPAGRPFAEHDRGFHNGWFKPAPPIQYGRPVYRQPVRQFMPAPRPIGWNDERRDGEHEWHRPMPQPNYWAQPRIPADGCDGDDCQQPAYRWRSDYPPQYQPSYDNEDEGEYENYGGQPYSWYTQSAPATYNLAQRRDWLIYRRQHAMAVIAQMRARGDSRGAGRMARAVNALTAQINAIDQQGGYGSNGGNGYNGGYGYTPSNYVAPPNPFLGAVAGDPGYYGAPINNPALNVIGALVAPMLDGLH